jgi:uncharacterized protein YdbL (DUF1318 family)
MNRRLFLSLFCVFLGLASVSGLRAADAAADAKARMRQRVGEIDRLKLSEAIGENNRGFLEARKPEAASVVDAENKDRSAVFAESAARANSTADAVGRAFAKQVAAASARGVWIQREDGSWQKK